MTIASVSDLEGGGGYAIAGTISEPHTDFGPSTETTLLSSFTGKWTAGNAGATISFTKTYRYDGHVVEYNGTYDEGAGIITGKWTITDAGGSATQWPLYARHGEAELKISPLLYADSERSADALYFGRVRVPDPFIAFGARGRKFAVVSALEFGRVSRDSAFDVVLPLEDWLKIPGGAARPRRRRCRGHSSAGQEVSADPIYRAGRLSVRAFRETAAPGTEARGRRRAAVPAARDQDRRGGCRHPRRQSLQRAGSRGRRARPARVPDPGPPADPPRTHAHQRGA